MEITKILMLSLATLSVNINSLKAMEDNNKINIVESNNNITYNKLSINKQTDFEINNCNTNIIHTQQDKIQKLESKIDEMIKRQKMFERNINNNNNVLHKELKQLKQDLNVSSAIFGSVNSLSDDFTKNTKQIQAINKKLKEIDNMIDTFKSVDIHVLSNILVNTQKQTEVINDNNKIANYLVNTIDMMCGVISCNYAMQFMNQNLNMNNCETQFANQNLNNINNINNINSINNNIQDNDI